MVPTFVSTLSCTVFLDLIVFDILSFLCNSVCLLSKESFSAHEHKNPRGDLFTFLYFRFNVFLFVFWLGYTLQYNKTLHVHKICDKNSVKLTRLLKSTHYFWYLEMKGVCAIFVTASCHKSVCACVRVFTV